MAPRIACSRFATAQDVVDVVCVGDLTLPADQTAIESALDAASDILVRLSGFRFTGLCTATVRPGRDACTCDASSRDACGCGRLDGVPLHANVVSITSVMVDGVVLGSSEYAILSDPVLPRLVRVAVGDRPSDWPSCQKLWRPSTEEGSFQIVYSFGQAPGIVEINAVVELAISILSANPSRNLSVVPGATGLSGGGVSLSFDPNSDADDSAVKLPAVATFVGLWNPREEPVPSAAWSPELLDGWSTPRFR